MEDVIILNKIFSYKVQEVRDLAWAIFSPPLIKSIHGSHIDFCSNTLDENEQTFFINLSNELDKNPRELFDFLATKNSRLLGKYFEALIEFMIRKSPYRKLLVANLQINSGTRTIGEIDFIYKNLVNDKLIHLETAGKFFLWKGDNYELSSFIGPNPNDSLDKKISKIKTSQLPLAKSDIVKRTLKSLRIKGNIESKVLFKGYLFTPLGKECQPPFAGNNFYRGFRINSNELNILRKRKSYWRILKRKEWVSPYFTNDKSQFTDWEHIENKIRIDLATDHYPILLSEIVKDKNNFVETSRFFITPPNWPNNFNNDLT